MWIKPEGILYAPQDEADIATGVEAKLAAVDARPTIASTNAIPRVSLDNTGINRYGLKLKKLSVLYNNPGVSYLYGTVFGLQPAYQYMLEPLHLVPSVDPTTKNVFFDRKFMWSVEGYGRVICPMWQLLIRVSSNGT